MKLRKKKCRPRLAGTSWLEEDGLHFMMPGTAPGVAELADLTQRYQENIRKSPQWKEIVQRFGQDEAERLLRECRVEKK